MKKANMFASDSKRYQGDFATTMGHFDNYLTNDSYAKKRLDLAKLKANTHLNNFSKSAKKPKFIAKDYSSTSNLDTL